MSKVIKAGNSFAITIPAKFVKQTGVKLGDEVLVEENPEEGKILLTIKNLRQLPLLK